MLKFGVKIVKIPAESGLYEKIRKINKVKPYIINVILPPYIDIIIFMYSKIYTDIFYVTSFFAATITINAVTPQSAYL